MTDVDVIPNITLALSDLSVDVSKGPRTMASNHYNCNDNVLLVKKNPCGPLHKQMDPLDPTDQRIVPRDLCMDTMPDFDKYSKPHVFDPLDPEAVLSMERSCSSTTLNTSLGGWTEQGFSIRSGDNFDSFRNSTFDSVHSGDAFAEMKQSCEDEICAKDTAVAVISTPRSILKTESKSKEKCSVHFSDVEIRNYPLVLGDNPCCSYGPPVCLGWEHSSVDSTSLEFYEDNRGKRRKLHQLKMNYYLRMHILKERKYSEMEIKAARKEASKTKLQREITIRTLPFFHFEMAAESARRKLGRSFAPFKRIKPKKKSLSPP
eukprot:CAMPEP_0194299024 /NCGR_PEP_ID=MMETSP0169-20130528/60497_1 /TAXON_ID=218684 /ORGANISM="Corethron pennatum, Strain L29A3" /LENGTH=317 /DNA_ID=CAMNT_0039049085 /DNA_START=547 /DNA_END=1500 /DNA_ORIENTATION=-